jgi:hypothetical protein
VSEPGFRDRAGALADTPAARLLAVGLILVAAAAVMLAIVLVDRPGSTARPLDDPITVKRSLSTSAALFGDPVEAEVDVYSDDARIAARSVRVSTSFEPYRVTATRVDRRHQGDVSLLRTRISLECLSQACLPPRGKARVLRFPPFAVAYRNGGREQRVLVPWEPLQVSSRLPADTKARVGIVDSAPLLESRFERSPQTLRAVFLLAAAVLGLAGAALVVTAFWPSSYLAQRRQRRLSPLERSLQQVEAAAEGDDEAARRRTLDDLATHLGEIPSPSLEIRTRALAWGQGPPDPEELTHLAEQVRATLNGGAKA